MTETSEDCDDMSLYVSSHKTMNESLNINENGMIEDDQGIIHDTIEVQDSDVDTFTLSKDHDFTQPQPMHRHEHDTATHNNNPSENTERHQNDDNCVAVTDSRQPLNPTQLLGNCGTTVYMAPVRHSTSQPGSSNMVYAKSHSDNQRRALTLDSNSQLLFSGVQTIPEQLPLILTEGDDDDDDDEEHDSLTVMTTSEHLQAVSTQAVLGGNPGTATGGLMVFSSHDIAPTGQLIPISGTNLLVLQSLDSDGQIIQPNSLILAGQQHFLPQSTEHMTMVNECKSSGKQYHCPHSDCPKIAPTSSKLKLHMLTHTGERPHKCPLEGCKWAFTTAYKLKRHIRGHTGERPFVCDFNDCGKCFTTTYNLKTHQKAHIREQDNICSSENCGQTFSTLHKLKVHEKKHQVENEFHICAFTGCGKQFRSLSNYNAHYKTHNGDRPHACTTEGCEKRFTKASKLKLHMRTHTGERPFVCEEEGCDWSFTSAYKLKRHMRKHTGERPFTCEFAGCGKSFTRASHMRTHALSHTGQKPYICPLRDCLKGFTAASSLNIHMRKHSGDKPFKCIVEGCDKAYTTAANLRLHKKRHEDKNQDDDEEEDKEEQVATDHPMPVRYVEIGGVNSVVDNDANPVPSTPYSVMHTFSGEDFGSEDVASLTVVQFSSEETYPPQTPVSTIDSSNGICFQFSSSANDAYTAANGNAATSISGGGLSYTTAGTPLPSPGVHYAQSSMREEEVEATVAMETDASETQFLEKCSSDGDSSPEGATGDRSEGFIVRGRSVQGRLIAGAKEDEDMTLPTMVVFTPSAPPTSRARPRHDVDLRSSEERRSSQRNVGHLTLEQPCENSSIDQFAPPAIIFQGEEVKSHDVEVKMTYCHHTSHTSVKEKVRTESLVPCSSSSTSTPRLLSRVANLTSIDKSPGSSFIGGDVVVEHTLDHESTINLQDLR